MRLNELLTEDQDLEEGPLLNKIGAGIGKVAGGAAKAVGAVAGGIAGLGAAAKKGFQAGKTTVAGAGDEPAADTATAATGTAAPAAAASTNTAAPTAATTPAASTASKPAKSNTSFGRLAQAAAGQDPDATEPAAGTTPPAAEPAATEKPAPAAEPAAGTTPPAATEKPAPAANDTAYAQAQKSISGLAPEQQKELLAALVADPKVKAALDAAAKKSVEKPSAAAPAGPNWDEETGAPLSAKAKAEYQTFSPEQKAEIEKNIKNKSNPSAKQTVAPTQAEIDADRARLGVGGSESVSRTGRVIAESEISHTEKLAAMNRGFQKGLSNPFASPSANDTVDSPAAVDTDIKDPSGTISVELIDRVNDLNSAQRGQLFKFLKARKQ
jgi:hypothetical protein